MKIALESGVASAIKGDGGQRMFHSYIVLGKKEYLCASVNT